MSEVPDKVISDAVKAVPATQAGVGSARMVRQIVVPAAPVIAGWARQQERERREARITEANRQRNAGLAALSLLRGRIARLIDLYEITPLLHENVMRDLRSLLPEEEA